MKLQRVLQKTIKVGWILLLVTGCSSYESINATTVPFPVSVSPTFTDTSVPSIELSEQPILITPSIEITQPPTSNNAASLINGSLQIEEGRCCAGGFAGDTIQVHVDFAATSPAGTVNKMRVETSNRCASEIELEAVNWEPFTSSKTYPVVVALNWVGYYVSVQFQDDLGNVSPVYCHDISVEGAPRPPSINPTDWYPKIQCFAENEVHPVQGETVTGSPVIFSWPDKNILPEGVFYKVFIFGAGDNYTASVASGQTREKSFALQIPPDRAGDIVWYVTLVDANGTMIDHNRCSSFPASLLKVDPPTGIKGIHFSYQP